MNLFIFFAGNSGNEIYKNKYIPINIMNYDWTEVTVLKIKSAMGRFTFWGQSVAGTRTCIIVEELKIAFDLGFYPRKAASCDTVFVSHGHADHMGSLHYHSFDRSLQRMEKPTYIMPEYCVSYFKQAYHALKHLNRHFDGELRENHSVIGTDPKGVKSEDVTTLKNGRYRVKSYEMIHTVPAVGFVIFEIKKNLREDLRHLSQKDIGNLARSGEQVNRLYEVPIIGYTGDTTIDGVLRHEDLLNSEILIMECTYLNTGCENDGIEKCHERGHIHEQDIIDNADKFQCKELMLCHFSRRYKKEDIMEARLRLYRLFGDRIKINIFFD